MLFPKNSQFSLEMLKINFLDRILHLPLILRMKIARLLKNPRSTYKLTLSILTKQRVRDESTVCMKLFSRLSEFSKRIVDSVR